MKKSLLYFLLIVIISCSKNKSDFKGFGGLDIGTEFKSTPNANSFRTIMSDEFNAREFVLSNAIGSVSNLNVTTQNGKICEVKFRSNDETNITELHKLFGNLVEEKVNHEAMSALYKKLKLPKINIKSYSTPDKKIQLNVIEDDINSLKNGKPVYEYSYSDVNYDLKQAQEWLVAYSKRKKS